MYSNIYAVQYIHVRLLFPSAREHPTCKANKTIKGLENVNNIVAYL